LKNRKALLICYYFPPLGGAGVGRPLALYKHLPAFGWECHVLTVKPVAYRVYEPELLDGLDTSHIYRAGSHDPQRLLHLLGIRKVSDVSIHRHRKISGRFFPDSKVGWVKPAIRMGRVLSSNNRYDVVISTSPPISSHLVAKQLSTELNIPWVADFRNFWEVHKPEQVFRYQRQTERALNLLKSIRQQATAITALNGSIASYVEADEVIHNGFYSDFAARWKTPQQSERFVIGVPGTLDDICPIEPLLKVVAAVREKAPFLFDKIKLLQVGRVNIEWLQPQLEKYGLKGQCDLHLFQKRVDTIKILSQASLFYLGLPSPEEKGVIPGRIYTLFASGRPILAAVPPDSEVEKLIKRTGHGFCFSDNNISTAVDYLSGQIRLFETNTLNIIPLPEFARQFSSDNLAKNFAHLFDQL